MDETRGEEGVTTLSVSEEPAGGEIRMRKSQDIGAGMYEMLKIEGIALDRGSKVHAVIQLTGAKAGPDNFDIGFTVDELTEGSSG